MGADDRGRGGDEAEGRGGGAGQLARRGGVGVEEGREVHHSGRVHGEDEAEAGDEGREAGGLRQGGDGEGEAGQDRGEGLLRGGAEEGVLSRGCTWGVWCEVDP